MVISWVEYNINDIVQMELNLNDNDLRTQRCLKSCIIRKFIHKFLEMLETP